jgi:hypothetical protein
MAEHSGMQPEDGKTPRPGTAANVGPVEKLLEITIRGDWFSDQAKMFADGIGIRELN